MENINNIEMKKLVVKLILLFVFFVLLIFIAVRWNIQQPVKSIKIEGTEIVPKDEIAELIKEKVIDTPKAI
jgi:cell division septal protein FtsQ